MLGVAEGSLKFEKLKKIDYFFSQPKKIKTASRILFFLPPGDQSRAMVEEGLDPWLSYFQRKAWTVVSPVAPQGKLFFRGAEKHLVTFLQLLREQKNLQDVPMDLLGVSNGGISAFRIATLHPDLFHSLTVVPGWAKPADSARLKRLRKIPVNLLVGAEDKNWLLKSRDCFEKMKLLGGNVRLEVIEGGDHFVFRNVKPQHLEKLILRR